MQSLCFYRGLGLYRFSTATAYSSRIQRVFIHIDALRDSRHPSPAAAGPSGGGRARVSCSAAEPKPSIDAAARNKNGKLWSTTHATVHRCIKRLQLLPKGASILMAVSGGQDSLCMAKLCLDMQHIYQWRLAVAHFDHRWRCDSEANARYVQQLADQWQLPCYHTTAHAGVRSEADAREWRYSSLHSLAAQHGYSHVATGHTASDVVETLLFNLFRGGGTDGMQSLAWKRSLGASVTLVRPLLALTRQETADLCQLAGLAVWEDVTNEDLKYARNRIRNELLPYLRQHFNSRLDNSVAELAEIVRDEVHCLDVQARQLLALALVRGEEEEEEQQQQQQQRCIDSSGAVQYSLPFGSSHMGCAVAAAYSTMSPASSALHPADDALDHMQQQQQQQQQQDQQHTMILPHCYQPTPASSSSSTVSSRPWTAADDAEPPQDLLLPPHACALDRRVLREAPVALQRRAVRLFLQATLRRGFNFSLVEQVVALVSAPNRSQTDHLLQRTFACVEGDYIRLKSL